MAQKNAWEMIQEPVSSDERDMFSRLCGDTGTLVIWENCDRLLNTDYDEPGGQREQRAIRYRVDSIRKHCGLVFHKFLDESENAFPNVTIEINDSLVEFWNPFYPSKSEQVLPPQEMQLEIEVEDGSTHNSYIKAWILPTQRI